MSISGAGTATEAETAGATMLEGAPRQWFEREAFAADHADDSGCAVAIVELPTVVAEIKLGR